MLAHLVCVSGYLLWVWKLAPPGDRRLAIAGTALATASLLFRLRAALLKRRVKKLMKAPPDSCPKCSGKVRRVIHGVVHKGARWLGGKFLGLMQLFSRLWSVTDVSGGLRGLTTIITGRPGKITYERAVTFDDVVCQSCGLRIIGKPTRKLIVASLVATLLLLAAILLLASDKYLPDWFPWLMEKAQQWWSSLRR